MRGVTSAGADFSGAAGLIEGGWLQAKMPERMMTASQGRNLNRRRAIMGTSGTRAMAPAATLARIRKLCLALPGAVETLTWGHPNFRIDGKIFAGFGQQDGRWCISGKVGRSRQKELLKDSRYLYSDYVGRFGWVSFVLEGRIDWDEVRGLLLASYRLIASKRRVEAMDGSDAGGAARSRRGHRRRGK